MKILSKEKLKDSSNSGTQSNEVLPSQLIFNKDKENKLKKELYLRFWMALILTNIFTYMLVQPSTKTSVEKKIKVSKDERVIKLKINEMTDTVGKDKYVALFAGNQHLTNTAKIIKHHSGNAENAIYLVKISISDLNKIAPYRSSRLDSYPVTKQKKHDRGVYEITI